MAGNDIGYSFSPTFENAQQSRGTAAAVAPQGAIQTLNFKLPQVAGSAISPLVGTSQRGTSFGGAVLQSVLRTVLGIDATDAFLSGSTGDYGGQAGQPRDAGSEILAALSGGSTPSAYGSTTPVVHPADDGNRTTGGGIGGGSDPNGDAVGKLPGAPVVVPPPPVPDFSAPTPGQGPMAQKYDADLRLPVFD